MMVDSSDFCRVCLIIDDKLKKMPSSSTTQRLHIYLSIHGYIPGDEVWMFSEYWMLIVCIYKKK